MNVKYVVFDLDGTLLDTLDDLYLSVNKILADHGYPSRSKSEVRSYLGNGVRALVNLALPKAQEAAPTNSCPSSRRITTFTKRIIPRRTPE
ncbi:MAG: HAD hydrolase-like protein [Christensenellales bacterium]